MAYTIVKSDGTILTTIQDGTINTNSTSLGLAGRNYAGWGQPFDTNFVHLTENFANNTPPPNPLRGQLWYKTDEGKLFVCPTDGEANAQAWLSLNTTATDGVTTFGTVNVTGNFSANNASITNTLTANNISTSFLTVTANATINDALVTTANIGTIRTTVITTGSQSTPGQMIGTWTVTGAVNGNAMIMDGGNLFISNTSGRGIVADNFYYSNGQPISFEGTYNDASVALYLPTYTGNVGAVGSNAAFNGRTLSTGGTGIQGNIVGNWTLTSGSRLQATYADLAERYEIDQPQPVGTVVVVGGEKEIKIAETSNSVDSVLGVISNSYAFLMNAEAGDDITHPAIALIGRVKVRVVGPIEKGDRITTAGNGTATKAENISGFGIALETNQSEEEKLVLCVIK